MSTARQSGIASVANQAAGGILRPVIRTETPTSTKNAGPAIKQPIAGAKSGRRSSDDTATGRARKAPHLHVTRRSQLQWQTRTQNTGYAFWAAEKYSDRSRVDHAELGRTPSISTR